MKAIDRLSDSHVLALGRFIASCALRGSRHWRTKFNECARRDSFAAYVSGEDHEHLRAMLRKHDRVVVCGLSTKQVVEAANQVAVEWCQPPITIDVPSTQPAAASG
jgi:hypothetical protein